MIKIKKIVGILLAVSAFLVNYSSPVTKYCALPNEIIVREGEKVEIDFGLPVKFENDKEYTKLEISTRNNDIVLGGVLAASIVSSDDTSKQVSYSAFGILPSRNFDVITIEENQVVLGGQSIGIILQCDGVLVVGYSEVILEDATTSMPAKSVGIQIGDFITHVDGELIDSAAHLGNLIRTSRGKDVTLSLRRNSMKKEIEITPKKDRQDKQYHIGIWGRDSSSGVGTLTYYIPNDETFAALGHSISDADSSTILKVREGEIYSSKIVEIVKGSAGSPGELRGEFMLEVDKIGDIVNNSFYGLYGNLNLNKIEQKNKLISVAQNHEIREGSAILYTTIDSEGIKGYKCEISKIDLNSTEYNKNFIVTVVDEDLIERTGGIVQGMSGSPIVQDGKLIGAVTHVFINNPKMGHGIFISSMINEDK